MNIPTTLSSVVATQCRRKFRRFVKEAWHVVEPAHAYIDAPHIHAVCDHLQAVRDGRVQNLLINEPPGHAKSLLVAVLWPAWVWLERPEWRYICATYANDLTLRDAMRCRQLIRSPWYQETFRPSWQLSPEQDAKGFYLNTRGGFRYSTSVGGQSTGHRGDCLIIDDALSATDAESDAKRAEVIWWYDKAFANRLNDLAKGTRVCIAQRLHEGDLPGHLKQQGDWVHLKLPTEFVPEQRCETSIGWRDWRTEAGELLFPQLFPAGVVASEKRRLGSYGYSGQHQQEPAPAGGGKFQRQWFRYFDEEEHFYLLHRPGGLDPKRVLKSDCMRFQCWDLAMTEKEENCPTVGGTFDLTPENDLLVLDVDRFWAEAPTVKDRMETSMVRWQPTFQGVEEAHYGVEVCQEWVRRGHPLKALRADKDKIVRAIPASLLMENGKAYFRRGAPWLNDFENELMFFPVGQYKDQVDVFAYAARIVNEYGGAGDDAGKPMKPVNVPGNVRGQIPRA